MLFYRTGQKSWQLHLGAQDDGDPMIGFYDIGDVCTLENAGSSYHLYEMIYDPTSNSANVYVDGIECFRGYEGFQWQVVDPYFGWGSSSSFGNANYNMVRLEIIPEPTTMALLVFGSIGLVRRRGLRGGRGGV